MSEVKAEKFGQICVCHDCQDDHRRTVDSLITAQKMFVAMRNERDTLRAKLETAEKERDYFKRQTQEQAATIVQMREALQKVMSHLVRYAKESDTGLLYQICRQAVEIPPTAYEQKVQRLVDTLESFSKDLTPKGSLYISNVGPYIRHEAQKALDAFRGGENS